MTSKCSAALKAILDYRDSLNKGRLKIVAKDFSSVVYFYNNSNGQPCAVGYRGRAKKPTFNYRYGNEQRRGKSVAEWMQSVTVRAAVKNEPKQRNLQVGDVLMSMWGYEQTNIDYYLVQKLVGKNSVEIIEIGTIGEATGIMHGMVIPDKSRIIGEPMIRRVSDTWVRISNCQIARKEEPKKIAGCEVYQAHSYSSTH